MPDFGRRNFRTNGGSSGDPSLDAIARSDRLIEALAAGQPVWGAGPDDVDMVSVLAGWRDDARRPSSALVSEVQAVAALRTGTGTGTTRGARMGMAVVGSVAAAFLCVGGFGAVIYGAGPGDAMYGMRTSIFGEPQSVRDDQVVLAAQTELSQVQDLIAKGDWAAAQGKLAAATTTVETVGDDSEKQALIEQWNRLNVQVEARDASATPPADLPLTVLPPSVLQLTPPVELPGSSPETSSSSAATPPPETASPSPETTGPSATPSPSGTTSSQTTTPSPTSPTSSTSSTTVPPVVAPAPPQAELPAPPSAAPPSGAPPSAAPPSAAPPTNTTQSITTTTTTTSSAPVGESGPSSGVTLPEEPIGGSPDGGVR